MGIKNAKKDPLQWTKEFHGEFYGSHIKNKLDRIEVLAIINESHDLVELNRVADFIENVKEPVEWNYGQFVTFELYTRENVKNFHSSFFDAVKAYDGVYDKEYHFKNLLREMLDPNRAIEHVKYISTIEYISVYEKEREEQ